MKLNKIKLVFSLLIFSVILVGCQDESSKKLEYEMDIEYLEHSIPEKGFLEGLATVKYVSHEEKKIYKVYLSDYDTKFNLEEYTKINKMKVKEGSLFNSDKNYFIKEIGMEGYLKLTEID